MVLSDRQDDSKKNSFFLQNKKHDPPLSGIDAFAEATPER